MSGSIHISSLTTDKKTKYEELLPQLKALVEGETDLIANLSNIMAALKYNMGFFWVGIYFVKNDELVLGPFQGPVACVRIARGKGVCGTSWVKREIIVVDDVEKFPGHIACNAESKSEIVIPIFVNREVTAVLDVDSDKVADFDETDSEYLGEISKLIEVLWK